MFPPMRFEEHRSSTIEKPAKKYLIALLNSIGNDHLCCKTSITLAT